jgi:hypothetical protein
VWGDRIVWRDLANLILGGQSAGESIGQSTAQSFGFSLEELRDLSN